MQQQARPHCYYKQVALQLINTSDIAQTLYPRVYYNVVYTQ